MRIRFFVPMMTYGLMSLNLLFFALEVYLGGSENIEVLHRLGALDPELVWQGQWWRVITANFLHYGWFHLMSNLLGIYVLGRIVEKKLGHFRYFLVYFLSGISTMIAWSLILPKFEDHYPLLVGASASIMGLVGVTTLLFFRDWRIKKSALTARRFKIMMVIIAFQSSLDLAIPQVSFLSHFLGMTFGAIIGGLLIYLRPI